MISRVPVRSALFVLCAAAGLTAACQRTPVTPPPSADAWAVVDGREIKKDAVEKAYRRTAQLTPTPSDEEALTGKLAVLNEFIIQDILLARAGALKVEVTDAELDTAYNEGRKDIPEEAFQQELTRRNLTVADMRDGLRRDLMIQKLMEREVSAKVAVSDQEITDFFNANRAQFERNEDAYHIAQIVVTPGRDTQVNNRSGDDAATPQQAAQKAQMLMERLKSGTSFGDLAADFSEDPQTAPRGGDLGFVPISALKQAPAQLRDAVLKAEPGTVTNVSQGGAHTLVLLVAKETAGPRDATMPDVRQRITDELKGRKEQLLRAAYLGAIRNDAVVVNHLAKKVMDGQGKLPAS